MNIEKLVKQWLMEHEHYEDEPLFAEDMRSLLQLVEDILANQGCNCASVFLEQKEYDPDFGDEKLCECGHTYDRHFDSYDNMFPVGCKYCPAISESHIYGDNCCPNGFKEKK